MVQNKDIDEIFKNIALYKYLDMIDNGGWGKKELNKICKGLSKEEREYVIDKYYPYLKTKQSYLDYAKNIYFPNIKLEKYVQVIRNKMFNILLKGESINNFFLDNNINISTEDKLTIKQFFIKKLAIELSLVLSDTDNDILLYAIKKLPMTAQTTLISCIKGIISECIKDDTYVEKTKILLSEWIRDPEIEWTIPNADIKMKQTIEFLDAKKIVCFCCPDYPGGFVEGTSIWKYDMQSGEIGDGIGFFGSKVFQIISELSKTIKALYAKLESIDIIMPSYQFFQSPGLIVDDDINQKYSEFIGKILKTGEDLKTKIEEYFMENGVNGIKVNVKLSSSLYDDEEIINMKTKLKNQITDLINSSDTMRKEKQKLFKYEAATGNIDPSDELVSYMSEGQLLQKCYKGDTLLVIPESPQMPKIVLEMQEILSKNEGSINGLPTLIIQKDRRFDL